MAGKKSSAPKKKIDSIRHGAKRVNIPTEELRDFVAEDEKAPKMVLYPRDTSLDPQLVWKGKDEQDSQDLAVPCVPVYIQEKIHPHALIENVRRTAQKESANFEDSLFGDFNGIDEFEKKIDFYHYDANWSNRMILGDSLLVMTSLAEKEGLKGKVQMIYIDPPYGIKFGSNWQVSTRKRDVKDGKSEDTSRQPEQVKAFRDTWELGIHSYLAYLRDRFVNARDLLTETGSIFVQIGDENVHLVRCLMDEVFGSENFCATITFVKSSGMGANLLPRQTDYLIWYAKNQSNVKYRQLYRFKGLDTVGAGAYSHVLFKDGVSRRITEEERQRPQLLPDKARIFRFGDLTKPGPGRKYIVNFEGRKYDSGSRWWGMQEESMASAILAGRVCAQGNSLSYIRFMDDFPAFSITNVWDDTGTGSGLDKVYVVQTDNKIIARCMLLTTEPGDLVLDPTCGSGTTAFVAEQWGRRWITVDTSRVALALARTRLMSAKYPYYILADSHEGIMKEAELTCIEPTSRETSEDIRKGFVYKRVPHVTLKSIANNPDIKEGMSREEIDAAIARHADIELLYDQPYEDNKRIRVTGPFTVESLSPHRVLSPDETQPTTVSNGKNDPSNGQFETMIIDNLRKAGVQNTFKNERLKFTKLDSYAGAWIQASGEYTDSDGKVKRVAVSIGPEPWNCWSRSG
jgi:adenine-specific DNA-methyltransferase